MGGAEVVVTMYWNGAPFSNAKASAASFCSLVKQGGGGCLAYSSSRTLPGAVASPTRVAAR